jgi:tetratricopeptide (TPR) repeat protein
MLLKKIQESIALYNQSITVLALHNDDYTMAVNYNNLGDYMHLEEYDKTISYFLKGLDITEKMDSKPLHMLYLNIAGGKVKSSCMMMLSI